MSEFHPEAFGSFFLLHRIAVGFTAEVFAAMDRRPDAPYELVAVKRYPANGSETNTSFETEHRVAALLNHSNVPTFFGAGVQGLNPWVSMEWVQGKSLRQLMRKLVQIERKLPTELAVYIAGEVCKALDHLHRAKDASGRTLDLIHSDVSPGNILLGYDGSVKLADFGDTRRTGTPPDADSERPKGQLRYRSPEHALNEPLSQKSDLFSLGAVLHEMLTGQVLFQGGTESIANTRVRGAQIDPPSYINPDIPQPLDKVVVQALEPHTTQRLSSVRALWMALDELREWELPKVGAESLSRVMGLVFGKEMIVEERLVRGAMEQGGARLQPGPVLRGFGAAPSADPVDDGSLANARLNTLLPLDPSEELPSREPPSATPSGPSRSDPRWAAVRRKSGEPAPAPAPEPALPQAPLPPPLSASAAQRRPPDSYRAGMPLVAAHTQLPTAELEELIDETDDAPLPAAPPPPSAPMASQRPPRPTPPPPPRAVSPAAAPPAAAPPRAEAPPVAAPRAEAPAAPPPRAEAPPVAAPRAEAPPVAAPRAEAPRPVPPKARTAPPAPPRPPPVDSGRLSAQTAPTQLYDAVDDADEPDEPEAEAAPPPGESIARASLLLASSDDALRVRLGRRLEAAGHSLQEASDGVEVLERLDRGGVDVAIVDLSMPRLSGAQIVERLRAQHSASALPVLVLAGGEKSAEVVRAIKLGANDYAHRGLDFELLHARVQGLIRLSVAARAAQTALAEVQSALEASAQLKLELSPEGRLRDASPGSKTLLGYAPEQLLGRLFFDLVHNQDSLALRQGAPAGQPLPLKEPLVLRLRRQDGRWIWVELRTRRVLGPDGRLQTLHAYATDVTARVEPEAVQPPAGLNLRVEDQRERARLANMLARIGYALVEDSPGQLRIVRTKKPDGSA